MMADVTFSIDDFESIARRCLEAWSVAVDGDWSVPAGTLEWSCLQTADHTIDCVFSYALFLGSRRVDSYPPFDLLRALPEAGPADLVDGLRAVCNMLAGTIRTAPPDVRAILMQSPPRVGTPDEFGARGALELALHTHDVCSGLGVPFSLPDDLAARLLDATADYPGHRAVALPSAPWSALVVRSGR